MKKKSSPKNPSSPALEALRKAAQGLVFTSETDAPLEAFVWPDGGGLSADRLRKQAGAEGDTAVEDMTLDDFFHAVPDEDKPKFDQLAQVLKTQLTGLKVYKIGDEAEKTVFIAGKTADGQWAGLKTTVVET